MPTFSYKGYDFEVDHTPTEQEFAQMSAYVDTLPAKKPAFAEIPAGPEASMESPTSPDEWRKNVPMEQKLLGLGETGLNLLTGAVGGMVGPLRGVGSALVHGLPPEEAAKVAGQTMEEMTFQPRTDYGQEQAARVGEVVNKYLIPVAPLARMPAMSLKEASVAARAMREPSKVEVTKVAPKDKVSSIIEEIKGETPSPIGGEGAFSEMSQQLRAGETSPVAFHETRSAMGDVALGLEEMGIAERVRAAEETLAARQAELEFAVKKQAELDRNASERARQEAATVYSEAHKALLEAQEQARLAMEADKAARRQQAELFDQPEQGRMPNPYEAVTGDWRIDENGIPVKVDLSMEARNLEQPTQRNLWGDELAQKHPQEAPRSLTEAIDSMDWAHRRGALKKTALGREIQESGELAAARMEAEQPQGGTPILPTDARATALAETPFNTRTRKQGGGVYFGKDGEVKVTDTPEPKIGEKIKLNLPWVRGGYLVEGIVGKSQFYDEYGRVVPEGTEGAERGILVTYKVNGEQITNSFAPNQLRENILGYTKTPFNFKKQGGGILFDWSKKSETEKIGENKYLRSILPELTRDATTPEEVIALAKASQDIPDRGMVKSAVGQFTKGLLYEKFKTDNPIVKYTYDVFSAAVDSATHRFDTLIKKQLTPALRSLSNRELGELGKVMVEAMKAQKEITPEMLQKHGFTQKQIDVVTKMQEIHKDNLNQLNAARESAGKKPISAYEAYLAGMATGNFKKLIYKEINGELEVIGVVGSDFRKVMNSRVEKLLAEHPEYTASEERYSGVRKSKQASTNALQEALAIVSDNNPHYAEFAKAMEDVLSSDVYSSLGAKKHTMGKKGVFGMQGDKPWKNDYDNAVDMFNAQIRYTQTMGQWAEYSKAMDEVSKILSDPEVRQKQPNAVKMAEDYVNSILGQNPTIMGRALDDFVGAVGDATGVGPNVVRGTMKLGRNVVNSLFFTLNHAWMLVNTAQPFMTMPETRAFLTSRGLNIHIDPTGWSDLVARGTYSSLKHVAGFPETVFEKGMWEYAKKHGIDQTQLVESANAIRSGPKQWISSTLKFGANAVEAGPRSVMFSTISHMLREGGFGKDPELFNVARQLTDMAMTDYRHHEQMKVLQQLGPGAELAANLTSFKQNTMSRYALFAREMGQGHYKAFVTALIAAQTLSGVMGLPGYEEADMAVKTLSKMIGKPTTLSKLTLDLGDKVNEKWNKAGDILNMGIGAYWGVDLHNRIGLASAMPTLTGGMGKLADVGSAVGEVASKPNEWNTKQLAREVAVGPMQPWMDDAWFTSKLEDGTELAVDKYGRGSVIRNDEDKLWKKLGFTGSHEAKRKAQNYGVRFADTYYKDKQAKIREQLNEVVASNHGNPPKATLAAMAKDYTEAQGDPNAWGKMVEGAVTAYRTSERQRRVISSQGGALGSAYKLQRSYTGE